MTGKCPWDRKREKNKKLMTKQHVYNMTLGLFGMRCVYGGLCMSIYVYIIKIWRKKNHNNLIILVIWVKIRKNAIVSLYTSYISILSYFF